MWPEPDEDDEEGRTLIHDPATIAKAEQDPMFREFVRLYLLTSDEGRAKMVAGMKRMAALPKEIQATLTTEQRDRLFNGGPVFPIN